MYISTILNLCNSPQFTYRSTWQWTLYNTWRYPLHFEILTVKVFPYRHWYYNLYLKGNGLQIFPRLLYSPFPITQYNTRRLMLLAILSSTYYTSLFQAHTLARTKPTRIDQGVSCTNYILLSTECTLAQTLHWEFERAIWGTTQLIRGASPQNWDDKGHVPYVSPTVRGSAMPTQGRPRSPSFGHLRGNRGYHGCFDG